MVCQGDHIATYVLNDLCVSTRAQLWTCHVAADVFIIRSATHGMLLHCLHYDRQKSKVVVVFDTGDPSIEICSSGIWATVVPNALPNELWRR